MPLQRMEHFLVVSDDLEGTKNFYRDVLGMTVGFRPDLGFPGYWLYVDDIPCVHLAEWNTYAVYTAAQGIPISTRAPGTGSLDHIAFNAADFDGIVARIEQHGIQFSRSGIDEIGLRQLFLKDPNGVTIELNFRSAKQ
jgi:catechol 2,3-dioxygenase-like lactoylglutathione lyase family enzyme